MVTLTAEQRAAAETTSRLAYVSAGPGSGKTTTLAARAAHLVRSGVEPSEILILAFTRSAASEIRRRIDRALGCDSGVTVRTFHAHAVACLPLAQWGCRVATEYEADAALRSLYRGRGPTRRPARRPAGDVPGLKEMRRRITIHEATSTGPARDVRIVLARLREARLVPTWDLVPQLRAGGGPTYAHVLCDEAQDASPNELEAAAQAAYGDDAPDSLFMVGDPRQAIMSWRGGTGPPEKPTHSLTHSFRFGAQIAAEVNALADRFGGAHVEGTGDPGTVEHIKARDLVHYVMDDAEGRVLVLCRTNRQCREIGSILTTLGDVARRDRMGDPLASEADQFALIWQTGGAVISTVHSAKGREADTVIVAYDHLRDTEPEEMRVAYVAASRARKRLVFVEGLA